MDSRDNLALPDFDRMASVFDRYLPLIEPVGSAVLDALPPLTDGAEVLDVACGTGEPGLTLARRSPGVHLLGIDTAPGMVELSRAKAAREGLPNARFEVMAVESLTCPDRSVDAVISRFGLLMFGDTAASARQLARVLRPGGSFSFAVWEDMTKNTLVRTAIAALRPHVPDALLAPFDRLEGTTAADRLRAAGLTDAHSAAYDWFYRFPNDDALWEFVSGPGIFGRQFGVLGEGEKRQVREAFVTSMAPYRSVDGNYAIPHSCRLHWGRSSSTSSRARR